MAKELIMAARPAPTISCSDKSIAPLVVVRE